MANEIKTGIVALLLVAALAPPARAATDLQTLFDWACTQDPKKSPNATAIAMQKCDVPMRGDVEACAVVTGSPWACYSSVAGPQDDCESRWNTNITITASTAVLGWTVQGTVEASASILFSGTIATCGATRNSSQKGSGGSYVTRAGNVAVSAIFKLVVGGDVTFLGGTVFGVSGKQTCGYNATQLAYKTATVNGCMPEN